MDPVTIELRPVGTEDAPTIHSVIRAAEVADGEQIVTSLDEVEEYWDDPHFHPDENCRIALADGTAAGWAQVHHRPSGIRLERAHLFGAVDPSFRRRGVGTALLRWQLERAREILGAYDHGLPCYIRTHRPETTTDAIALYEAHEMRPVRWTDEMIRTLDPPPHVHSAVDIAPWTRELDAAVREVKNAAFADHWGSTPDDEASWTAWLGERSTRLDLSFVAVSGGRPVGYVITAHYPDDEQLTGRRDGWIQSLGVSREWRGRGIASSLIARSLEAFTSAGLTHAMIGVDTENPTGAAGLYRRLGFEPIHRIVTHELEVDRPAPTGLRRTYTLRKR